MPLDIGIGIILGIGSAHFFGTPLEFNIMWGIIFSLLPDLDFILYALKNRNIKHAYKHRELFHLPLIYISVGTLILSFLNPSLTLLFVLASLFHFLHDSIGIGWGIPWTHPLRTTQYMFLYQYLPECVRRPIPKELKPNSWRVWRFKEEDVDLLAKTYGDEQWIRNIYLKFHWYAIVEYVVFALAVSLLYLQNY